MDIGWRWEVRMLKSAYGTYIDEGSTSTIADLNGHYARIDQKFCL